MEMSRSIISRDFILNKAVKEMNHNNWRYGQALYNTTFIYYPEFCEARTGTEKDPFYCQGLFDQAIQQWHYELKIYVEDLLEKREAELSAAKEVDKPAK